MIRARAAEQQGMAERFALTFQSSTLDSYTSAEGISLLNLFVRPSAWPAITLVVVLTASGYTLLAGEKQQLQLTSKNQQTSASAEVSIPAEHLYQARPQQHYETRYRAYE